MKLRLPSRLVQALLTTCTAALTTNAPVFADVPEEYTPVTITDVAQLNNYRNSDNVAFIIHTDITNDAYRMTGAHQYWSDDALDAHALTFSSRSSSESGGALSIGVELVAEELEELMFIGNKSSVTSSSPASYNSGTTYSSTGGGAIYADASSAIHLKNNESLSFGQNYAYAKSAYSTSYSSSNSLKSLAYAKGGAIKAISESVINIENNESLAFNGNYAYSYASITFSSSTTSSKNLLGESASEGGAIHGTGVINLICNETAIFEKNYAYSCSYSSYTNSSPSDASASGGVLYGAAGGTINLTNNSILAFRENYASSKALSSATSSYSKSESYGGAIASYSVLNLSNNDTLEFERNYVMSSSEASSYDRTTSTSKSSTHSASYGGAIYSSGTLNIINNSSIAFKNNYAKSTTNAQAYYSIPTYPSANSYGGAIYGDSLNLIGNDQVVFRGNYEVTTYGDSASKYRLRSVYIVGSSINLSAGEGQEILFYDTLQAGSNYNSNEMTVALNKEFYDKQGVLKKAAGDIVFSGMYAESDLAALKHSYTDNELINSKTTEVYAITNLYGGRLRIEDGAIYKGNGIELAAESEATLALTDGVLDLSSFDAILNASTTLALKGKNSISASNLSLHENSNLSFVLGDSNITTAALALEGSLSQEGAITINIQGDSTFNSDGTYMLISMESGTKPDTWDETKIILNGAESNQKFLKWDKGNLYYSLPALTQATWSGKLGREWNYTDKNWTQDSTAYRYEDGVDVVFGDFCSGTVELMEVFSPNALLVENTSGHDYVLTGEGSLAGVMMLTKNGDGKLSVDTSNDYTGGTAINGGTVALGSVTALGTGDIQLNDGVLDLGGNTIANNIITPEDAIVTIGNGTTTGNLSIAYTELSITGNVQVDGQIQASLENMIIVDAGATLGISQAIANTGTYLEISGSIDISKMHGEVIGTSLTGGEDPANGFLGTTERVQVIDNVSGGDVYIDYANFYHLGIETQVDDNFMAEVMCSADYTVFYLNENTEKLSTALNGAAAAHVELASVEMKSGTQLDVDSNANASLIHVESGTVTMNIAEGVTLAETDTTRSDFILQGKGRYSLMNGSTTLGATVGDAWQGIVQISSATFSALNLNDYGTANSTVSLNGVSAKLVNGTTFSANLELLGAGLTITDFATSGLTYVFAGNVSGDGNMTFNPSGMRHRTTFVFTGDVSQWTGTYENMVANRTSTLQFYGNASEMGAAIKQTAGAVSVIVGNGTDEHATTFTNTVEAGSLTVQEHATAILGANTTITDSLALHGQLETKGGSLSLGANATMQIGSAMGMKANKEGDINVSDNTVIEATSMHGKNGMGTLNNVNVDIIEDYTIENMSIRGSVIDISEGKHLYVKHVNIAADARITDEAAWLDMVDTHGWLDNTNTVAEEPVMSLGDTLFYRSGDDAWMRLDHDVSYVALTSELFSNVTMTGSDLWLDLTGLADTLGSACAFSIAFKDALYDVNGLRVVATVDGEHYFDGYYTTKQEGTTTTLYFSSQIPEPTTSTLSLLALAALAARKRRK